MRFIQLHLRNQVDLQHHDKIAKMPNYKFHSCSKLRIHTSWILHYANVQKAEMPKSYNGLIIQSSVQIFPGDPRPQLIV